MRCSHFAALLLIPEFVTVGATPPKPLAIQNVALSQYEDGPKVPVSYEYVPGETIFLSFQVAGYQTQGDDEPQVRLEWRIEAKDPSGVLIVEPQTGKVATSLTQEDKEWMPKARQTILVPAFAPSGTYRIDILVRDEIAQAEVRKSVEFKVRGRQVEPSPTLVIRNLRFYRTEEDKQPLEVAAYRPGDTVWIRFDMTGYKFGEKNHYDVGYGIQVLKPNGETTLSQRDAALETDESFYPRAYVPAAFSLNLPHDVMTGEYTVVITVRDQVGHQKYEARQTFTVEK
jgi:hypothetical protein